MKLLKKARKNIYCDQMHSSLLGSKTEKKSWNGWYKKIYIYKTKSNNNSSVQVNKKVGTAPSRSGFSHFIFLRKKKYIYNKEALFIHGYISM